MTIYSGTEFGRTLGTPIMLLVNNRDQRPQDYGEMSRIPRPSHADYTYQMKYGVRASSGGGRSSARETIGRVAAGAIAEKWLREQYGTEIVAWVSAVGDIEAPPADLERISRAEVDQTIIRCPDTTTAARMQDRVREVLEAKDSTGGILTCVWAWNDFIMPLVLLTDPADRTLVLGQSIFQGQFNIDHTVSFASYLMAMAPLLIVYVLAQRWVISGVTRGSIK